jgi:2-dehydropantoate 2-reductase
VRGEQNSTKLRSGIWRDLAVRRRPTEVTAQFAAMQQAADRCGLRIPINDRLVALIAEVEAGRREIGMELANELLAVASKQPGRPTDAKVAAAVRG